MTRLARPVAPLLLSVVTVLVLGVVGAGGIGQELKNSMDLLDFPRLVMIIILILGMVTIIDHLSTFLRKRLA